MPASEYSQGNRIGPAAEDTALSITSSVRAAKTIRRRQAASEQAQSRLTALSDNLVERVAHFFDIDEARSNEILEIATNPSSPAWQRARGRAFETYSLEGGRRASAADCGLVRLEAGETFPRHRHAGEEWCFILSGKAREDGGEIWAPGDVTLRPSGSRHSLTALGDTAFVYAVVLHGRIELD